MTPALEYCERGWSPIPVPFGQKAPRLRGWQNRRITAAAIPRYFNGKPINIGILLGEPSDGLADIHLDCSEALSLADQFLPSTGSIFGRAAKPRSHRVYLVPEAASVRFADPLGGMLVELRSTGTMTIFPGSVHPSGEAIEWDTDGEPAHVGAAELIAACGELARACLVLRHVGDDALRLPSERWPELLDSIDPKLGRVARHWCCHTVTPEAGTVVRAKPEQNQSRNTRHNCHTNGHDVSGNGAAQFGEIPAAARAYASAALEREAEIAASTAPGSQGNALNAAARKLAELVTAGALSEDEVREALSVAGAKMRNDPAREPWTPEQITETIESGLTAGKAHPPRDLSGVGQPAMDRSTVKTKRTARSAKRGDAPPLPMVSGRRHRQGVVVAPQAQENSKPVPRLKGQPPPKKSTTSRSVITK